MARALAALVLLLAFAAAGPVCAKDKDRVWPVDHRLLGKDGKKSTNVSGIACATDKGFPRTCLVIDDDLQMAQVVIVNDGQLEAGKQVPLIDNRLNGEPVSLDGEGIAFADGFFYVMGSHGRPRSVHTTKNPAEEADERLRVAANIAASSQIIRLKYDAASGAIASERGKLLSIGLRKLIDHEPQLICYLTLPLEKNGLTIEGIAVQGGRLFAGFRGPVVGNDKRAIIMSARLGYFFDDTSFKLETADAKVNLLNLGGRGVRDLAAYNGGILILAGPVGSTDKGEYSVFWWDESRKEAKHLGDLDNSFKEKKNKETGKIEKKQLKPEALLPLDRNAKGIRVLVLSDGAKEGEPHAVRVPYP